MQFLIDASQREHAIFDMAAGHHQTRRYYLKALNGHGDFAAQSAALLVS
jgi:hypothetical protein